MQDHNAERLREAFLHDVRLFDTIKSIQKKQCKL